MRVTYHQAVSWAAAAAGIFCALVKAEDHVEDADTFYSALSTCPAPCAGSSTNWTVYTSTERLELCEKHMLLDFAVHNPLPDPNTPVKIFACTPEDSGNPSDAVAPRQSTKIGSCLTASIQSETSLVVTSSTQLQGVTASNIAPLLQKVEDYCTSTCNGTFSFGYTNGTAVGVYVGPGIDAESALKTVFPLVFPPAQESDVVSRVVAQVCGNGRNADHVLGVVVDDLDSVQDAMQSWSNGRCAELKGSSSRKPISLSEAPLPAPMSGNNSTSLIPGNVTLVNTTTNANQRKGRRVVLPRSDCKTQTVASGDSCSSLAQKCGVSPSDFTKYNPDPKLCANLQPKQRVCCSAGTLPDIRPKANKDGSCAAYTVQSGDTCYQLAAANGLQVKDISTFNDKTTWGWFGCDKIMAGLKICLSKGNPPMPAPVSNALCGPTVPGTSMPTNGTELSDLNPCPLNACCDIWGQCGITPEYCTKETGPTKNPGTAPTGKNGCISNCGTSVSKNGGGPATQMTVGYYESWNWDRSCLNMRPSSIDTSTYTHVHWGFGIINKDFSVAINDSYKQWQDFVGMQNTKRIVSFGGWGYSTDPSTYNVLRTAMNPSNVGGFTDNLVSFLNKNKLDGLDFDWEYPGAPDIPGVPPGLKSDGPNYLNFLKVLRGKMPKGSTMSIAAPASYWYLRAFPIKDMAKYLDYIVYMTYDLHGQWDYGNKWSQEGCLKGNCLRSHVNMTETMYALAMITKAGVFANKVVVGVSSYGRSFGMTQGGCTGPMCGFGGPESTAKPGRCTVTAGYISNAEIREIINLGASGTKAWFDKGSQSNMLVYGGNQWVAYLEDDTKANRITQYQGLMFAGSVDWAIDLQGFTGDDGEPNDNDDDDDDQIADELQAAGGLPDCDGSYSSLDALDADADKIPAHCSVQYTMDALNGLFSSTMDSYNKMIADGYDGKFKTYAGAVADNAASSVVDFMNNNGNKYFTCVMGELSICCSDCRNNALNDHYCNYCFDGKCYKTCNSIGGCTSRRSIPGLELEPPPLSTNNLSYPSVFDDSALMDKRESPAPQQVLISKAVKEPEPCPPDYSKRGYGPDNPYEQTVWWTMSDGKQDTFYADLLTSTGIPKDKIKFGDKDRGNDCPPSAKADDDCWYFGMDYNYPQPDHYGADDVTNPKTLVQKALTNSGDLAGQVSDALDEMRFEGGDYWFGGGGQALVDAVSLPVLMIADAVDNMATVVATADKIDEEKRKALILAFIGALLFFVPIAGEVLGSVAELGDLGAIIATLGEIGNAAMDVYTIVDDPKNAPLAIMGLILSPLALADAATIAKAANIRRGMSDGDIAKLGGKVGGRMKTIQKVAGTCKKV